MPITRIENAAVWTGRPSPAGTAEQSALAFDEHGVIALGDEAMSVAADFVVDGAGGFVGPAFRDGHAHPLAAGLEAMFAPIGAATSIDEAAAAVASWAAEHPDEPWVRGEGFDAALAPEGVFRAEWLDAVVADRPVALRASDYHTVWVNSEALRRVGYTAATPDPPDGRIVRDADGSPVGTLREWGAWRPVYALLPPRTTDQGVAALAAATRTMAASGIAWVQDAWVEPVDVDAWLDALRARPLPVRADLALWCDPNSWRDQLEAFESARARVTGEASGQLSAGTVKFFADGVIESGTGALLEPYHDCPHSRGLPNWDAEELAVAVEAVAARGFAPHIHAIGDAGVRTALDAVERGAAVRGRSGARATIAHAQLIDHADLPRFARLGVVANFEPYWAQWDSCQEQLSAPRLGHERTQRQYQLRSMLDSGATVSFGSDWPVSTPVPLDGIQVAVTRQAQADHPPWMPEERVTVEEALVAYTAAVADQAGDARGGRLVPGHRADVVLLDADPRGVEAMGIAGIEVLGTWCDGRRTHGG